MIEINEFIERSVVAVKEKNVNELRAILANKNIVLESKPASSDEIKWAINNALQWACAENFLDGAKLLVVDAGADVNSTTDEGLTALSLACSCRHVDIVEFLLSCENIDVNKENDNKGGHFPLFVACSSLDIEVAIVKLLLSHPNIDVNKRTNNNGTALNMVCGLKNIEIIKLLLDHPEIDHNRAMSDHNTETPTSTYDAIKSFRRYIFSDDVKDILITSIYCKELKKVNKFLMLEEAPPTQKTQRFIGAYSNNPILNCFTAKPELFCAFTMDLFVNFKFTNPDAFLQQYSLLYGILSLPNTSELAQLCWDLGAHFYSDSPTLAYLFFDKIKNVRDTESWRERCLLASMQIPLANLQENTLVTDLALKASEKYLKAIIKIQLMKMFLGPLSLNFEPEILEEFLPCQAPKIFTAPKKSCDFLPIIVSIFKENPELITIAITEFVLEQMHYNLSQGYLIEQVNQLTANVQKYFQNKNTSKKHIYSYPYLRNLLFQIDDFKARLGAVSGNSSRDDASLTSAKHQKAVEQWLSEKEREEIVGFDSRCDDFFFASTSKKHQEAFEEWQEKTRRQVDIDCTRSGGQETLKRWLKYEQEAPWQAVDIDFISESDGDNDFLFAQNSDSDSDFLFTHYGESDSDSDTYKNDQDVVEQPNQETSASSATPSLD